MIRTVLASALALGLASGSALAQTPPLLWDGVIVPTAGTCLSDTPISWRATYRPYISDELSGAQPTQLAVYTNFQKDAFGLRKTTGGQLNGKGVVEFFFVSGAPGDISLGTAGKSGVNRKFGFKQKPAVVDASTVYIEITGTIRRVDNNQAGLRCATAIRGVFVKRGQPAE